MHLGYSTASITCMNSWLCYARWTNHKADHQQLGAIEYPLLVFGTVDLGNLLGNHLDALDPDRLLFGVCGNLEAVVDGLAKGAKDIRVLVEALALK